MKTETIQEFLARGGYITKIPTNRQIEARSRLLHTMMRLGLKEDVF